MKPSQETMNERNLIKEKIKALNSPMGFGRNKLLINK